MTTFKQKSFLCVVNVINEFLSDEQKFRDLRHAKDFLLRN